MFWDRTDLSDKIKAECLRTLDLKKKIQVVRAGYKKDLCPLVLILNGGTSEQLVMMVLNDYDGNWA